MYNKELDRKLIEGNLKEKKKRVFEHRIQLLKHFRIDRIIVGLFNRLKNRVISGKPTPYVLTNNSVVSDKVDINLNGLKLCVYTCIVGNYDILKEPVDCDENIDYIIFTDQEISPKSKWRKIDITQYPEYKDYKPFMLNRMFKMLPHRFLGEYDYSMYIDGSVRPITYMTPLFRQMGKSGFGVHTHGFRDCAYDEAKCIIGLKLVNESIVNAQVFELEKEGFPKHYGLFENTILIRKHCDEEIQELMEMWWKEYCKWPTRDQISLPYVMWKKKFDKNKICVLGINAAKNVRFDWLTHTNPKAFRMDR